MRKKHDSMIWPPMIGIIFLTLATGLFTGCKTNASFRGGADKDSPVTVKLRLKTQDEINAEDRKYRTINTDGKFGEEQAFRFAKADPNENPCDLSGDCSHEKIIFGNNQEPSADLFIVEFDDQGRLYYPKQMEHLFDFLKKTMSPRDNCTASESESCFDDVSLVVAVHGWRHNADFNDRNLRELRQVLHSALTMEQSLDHWNPSNKARKVVGVYVGWRGAVADEESWLGRLLFLFTFWDRKGAALDVALGSTRELFSRLGHLRTYVNSPVAKIERKKKQLGQLRALGTSQETLTEVKESQAFQTSLPFKRGLGSYEDCIERAGEDHCLPMRVLIVGHSFGSLAIYNAISASLIESVTEGVDLNMQKSPPPSEDCSQKDTAKLVSSPHADLIVLINPAFEGARFEPLYQATLNRTQAVGFSCGQPPVLAIITGTKDWATLGAFPIGRWFSTRFTNVSPRDKDNEILAQLEQQERIAEREAVGHIPRYMTHYLDKFSDYSIDKQADNTDNNDTSICLAHDWRQVNKIFLPQSEGIDQLEDVIKDIKNKWKTRLATSFLEKKPWPARAFCGQLRLSFAMHETTEEAKDPLSTLPDPGKNPGPWMNQLTLTQSDSTTYEGQTNPLPTRNPYNPIWVIRTKDPRIISSHNDYLSPYMVGFIHQLYRDVVSVKERQKTK